MATATKATRSFGVTCPFCGDHEATVRIDLNDLTTVHCSSCDEEYSPKRARDRAAEQLSRWDAVCRWLDLAGDCSAE
jgi:transcription elongation factor Elf1